MWPPFLVSPFLLRSVFLYDGATMLIKIPRGWELPESSATPESAYLNRRQLLKTMGIGGAGLMAGCFLSVEQPEGAGILTNDAGTFSGSDSGLYPAARNETYTVPERGITPEQLATEYNNFYEFTTSKRRVWELVDRFQIVPWSVSFGGLIEEEITLDLDDILGIFELEERLYRFRCVEAWSMTVPWTGFPLSALIEYVRPLSSATHVRMISENRPEQMPGVDSLPNFPWPYHEGLRMDEAMNELAFVVTGLYGKPLPRQNGAPIRLIVPWKYGYKSTKSIVRMEFVDEQPPTLWNTLNAREYGFLSNVDPTVDHPRWSQATETLIDSWERIPTLLYNGYEEYVGHMYT
jgi:sulfoxide reductase catalytic subunit YedY